MLKIAQIEDAFYFRSKNRIKKHQVNFSLSLQKVSIRFVATKLTNNSELQILSLYML